MRARMLRPVMTLILTLTLILVASVPAEAAWPTFSSGMSHIPAGQYFVAKDFIAKADAGASIEVQVMNVPGPTVDVLLMDKQNFELYKSGDPFGYHNVSSLNVNFTYYDTGVGSLINGLEYFLVIDNTNRPVGGAPGNSEVEVSYVFGGLNIQTVFDWSFVLIMMMGMVVAGVVVVVLVIVLIRKSKRKGQIGPQTTYGQTYQQPGIRMCPNCGAQAPTEFAYCPRCGSKY